MIRLYIDEDLKEDERVGIPTDEWHYLMRVRRWEVGSVEVFNRKGQIAEAEVQGRSLRILKIQTQSFQIHSISIHMALPEQNLIGDLIRSTSELGIEKIEFFEGGRSQKASSRLKKESLNLEKWNTVAIESARQCGRGAPILVSFRPSSLEEVSKVLSDSKVLFFDESRESQKLRGESRPEPSAEHHLLIGPEGGWSSEERDLARQKGWIQIHFDTPILTVHTAAIVACSFALFRRLPAL